MPPGSGLQLADHLAVAERDGAADGGHDFLAGIDAEQVLDGGVQILHVDGFGGLFFCAFGIGFADDAAAGEAAAGHEHAEAASASGRVRRQVDLRRAAKFAAAQDDGVLEQVRAASDRG